MKIGVLVVLGSLPYLDKIGELIIGWTEGNTALQIIFVMFVSPLILNTLQYLIVDEMILSRIMLKSQEPSEYRDEESDEDDDGESTEGDEETEYDARKGIPVLA